MKAGAGAIALAVVLAAGCTGEPSVSEGTTAQPAPGASSTTPSDQSFDGYSVCWSAEPASGTEEVSFSDETESSGLDDALTGMRGHAAAWGDVDGDGFVDLFVGTFATARTEIYQERGAGGPAPDRLLLGRGGSFELVEGFPEQFGRTSGAALVDLDGDGDLDLVASRNFTDRDGGVATVVFENTPDGFVEREGGIDPNLGGRSVGVLDYDGDGLLDLVILEDHYRGGSSRLYRNEGGFMFEDATGQFGFPEGVHGLGLAIGDLNNDGYSDLFVAGSNRLFAGTGSGFTEVAGAVGDWETFGPEDDVSGAAIADVNRDGWLDLVVGHHFNSTVDRGSSVPVRLYLNETGEPGASIKLRDATEAAGLIGLPTKAPHVEVADMDNDGWPDIVTSASAGDGSAPAIFRHLGLEDGVPQFSTPEGLGSPQYWVAGPTSDVNRDGRLDLLAVEWEPALPSIMFMNHTASGNWLQVTVNDGVGGVGARVEVYEGGQAGDVEAMLGARDITASLGYTAGVELMAHFGLGEADLVDIVVTSAGGDPVSLSGVAANSRISVGGDC
ncbi:MAG: CRTAC1 family protein [Acidimicrobiia bacterium]